MQAPYGKALTEIQRGSYSLGGDCANHHVQRALPVFSLNKTVFLCSEVLAVIPKVKY